VGKNVTSRATMTLKYLQANESELWDDITTMWDDITTMWDGEEVTGITVTPYISITTDDPSGSPLWSSWRPFFIGDFVGRAYRFKLEITSTNSNYNLEISELSVTIDMPDLVDSGSVTTGTGGASTVTYSYNFYEAPDINGTIVNGNTGDYIAITSITNSNFSVAVKNSSDSFIAKSVIWMAKGH
jgi:hypothetical protein